MFEKFKQVGWIIGIIYGIIFIPVIIIFLYSLYNDPATIDVLKAVGKKIAEKFTNNLSNDTNTKQFQQKVSSGSMPQLGGRREKNE